MSLRVIPQSPKTCRECHCCPLRMHDVETDVIGLMSLEGEVVLLPWTVVVCIYVYRVLLICVIILCGFVHT